MYCATGVVMKNVKRNAMLTLFAVMIFIAYSLSLMNLLIQNTRLRGFECYHDQTQFNIFQPIKWAVTRGIIYLRYFYFLEVRYMCFARPHMPRNRISNGCRVYNFSKEHFWLRQHRNQTRKRRLFNTQMPEKARKFADNCSDKYDS